jgi:hypothetical protein
MPVANPLSFLQGLEPLDPLVDRAQLFAKQLAGSPVEPIAKAFIANIETTMRLLVVPVACVGAGYLKATNEMMQGMMDGTVEKMFGPDVNPRLAKAFTDSLSEAIEHVQSRIGPRTQEVLDELAGTDERVADTFQALARAAVAQSWTGFECVAADAWVAALNADPRLGQSALVAPAPAEMPEGLTNKSISIGLLGKYRFDLRRSMGTVLRDKFHFGKVEGIKKAYAAAFGKKAPVLGAFDDRDLLRLEATRHLVVHRGGIIDDDYRNATRSDEPVGSALTLSGANIAPLVTAGASASCAILEFVATLACGR